MAPATAAAAAGARAVSAAGLKLEDLALEAATAGAGAGSPVGATTTQTVAARPRGMSPPRGGWAGGPVPRGELAAGREAPRAGSNSVNTCTSPGSRLKEPFLIGVAGGTASGKTTVCDHIIQRLSNQRVSLLALDCFYRGLTQEEMDNVAEYNFDHPDAFDYRALIEVLLNLKRGLPAHVPTYDFKTHQRGTETKLVNPGDVIILEGILVLHVQEVLPFLNMKIFVDTDDDVRLARRIQRDTLHRGRDVQGVIEQYTKFVKPMFDQFILPSKKSADVIIPWGNHENMVAIDLIVQHIRSKLGQDDLRRIYPNLHVVDSNFQVKALHTIIRDQATGRSEFIFYADRLIRIIVEFGLGFLPFQEKIIHTPSNEQYIGVDFVNKLCGVSIVRSGESMENALRACCKGIKIGKILANRAAEEQNVWHRLPKDIRNRHVLLMDPVIGTGDAALHAIKLLRTQGVEQKNILLLSLIAVPEGITKIFAAFPEVKIITSEIDREVDQSEVVRPGIGSFGDRYFCE